MTEMLPLEAGCLKPAKMAKTNDMLQLKNSVCGLMEKIDVSFLRWEHGNSCF